MLTEVLVIVLSVALACWAVAALLLAVQLDRQTRAVPRRARATFR